MLYVDSNSDLILIEGNSYRNLSREVKTGLISKREYLRLLLALRKGGKESAKENVGEMCNERLQEARVSEAEVLLEVQAETT